MSNQSIIEHKANMFYVEFREDYLALCLACTYKKLVKGKEKSKASPYCKSLILAISESWTNDKRGKGTDLSFYMTYPQWCESMYGMFGRNVVIDSVDELIGEGLLRREPIKYKGKDTFRYTLNHAEINRRMKALPDCTPYNTRPQVNALTSKRDEKSTSLQVNGNAFTNQRDTSLQVNGMPFTKGRNIESTNHPDIDSTQNTESDSAGESQSAATATATADRDAHAPDLSQQVDDAIEDVEQELRRKSGALSQDSDGYQKGHHDNDTHSHSSQPAGTRRNRAGAGATVQQPAGSVARGGRTSAVAEKPAFTDKGQKVFDAWCSLFKSPPRAAEKTIDCANDLHDRLVPWCVELHVSCAVLLKEIKGFLFATDTNGFYKRGVTLCDVDRDFEKWQSAKTEELEREKKPKTATSAGTVSGLKRWTAPTGAQA